jgi:hypothetical protein
LRQEGGAMKHRKNRRSACGAGIVQLRLGAGHAQRGGKVDLKKLFGARAGVLPIQRHTAPLVSMPHLTARSDDDVGAAQVAQHLGRRRVGVCGLGGIAAVQRAQPALGFEDGEAVAVALVVLQRQAPRPWRPGWQTAGCRAHPRAACPTGY